MAEGYYGLHRKLVDRFGKGGDAAYMFVACAVAMTVSGFAAFLFKEPLLFPSLGPTAFLFFETPMIPPASPRNTLIGHFVAILAGVLSLAIFGLLDHPSILQEGATLARVGAGALSVALTGAIQRLLNSSHPPAGATVLLVSLGLLQTPQGMVMLMTGVVLLTIAGWIINRAVGVPVPVWASKE